MTDWSYVEATVPKLERFEVPRTEYACAGGWHCGDGNHHVPKDAMTEEAREHYDRVAQYDPVPLCDLHALQALR